MTMRTVVLLLFAMGLAGCTGGLTPPAHTPLVATVSVEPHAFLVEQIGGGKVQAEVLVPQGKEPETYQVTPDKLAALSKAKIYFRTGMPFENALLPKLKAVAKEIEIVDLRNGLTLQKLAVHHHGHEHTDSHTASHAAHGETDPHIWFAPALLKKQAETVLSFLQQFAPAEADFFQKNYGVLLAKIDAAQSEMTEKLKPLRGKPVFVLHPAYGYFCSEFGLEQRGIEFEGKQPKPQQVAELIAEIKKLERPPVIFVQPEFHPSSAKVLAETVGAKLVLHSPLDRDVLQSMKRFAEQLAK